MNYGKERIADIIKLVEEFAPPALLKEGIYDNIGLIYGSPEEEVTGILITLDLTPEIALEAVKKKCNLIIEHHPTIFYPIKNIDSRTPLGQVLDVCVKNCISIYAAHTNVDFTDGGLNDKFAELLGCENIIKLDSKDPSSPRIGTLKNAKTLKELAQQISVRFNDGTVFFVGDPNKIINKIACVNGAGASDMIFDKVFKAGIDVFVSSEFKHHQLRLANDSKCAIISLSHFSSEMHFLELIYTILNEKDVKCPVYMSTKCNSPA